jgi:hypothetical protein
MQERDLERSYDAAQADVMAPHADREEPVAVEEWAGITSDAGADYAEAGEPVAPPRRAESIEQALADAEREADVALRAANRLLKGLRQLKHAAQQGDVRKLRGGAEALRQSIGALQQAVDVAARSWTFDEEGYLRDGRYLQELLSRARDAGLQVTEQDERLYAYPLLITADANRRAVMIDRKPERHIRPSTLVEILRARQQQPPRFKPARFIEALHTAYAAARAMAGRDEGAMIRLVDVYAMLTIMPGSSSDYALAEFTRDVHLLDVSGENSTRSGAVVTFDASTATRGGRGVLSIVTKNGAEKRYYGVSFATPRGG